MIPVDSIMQAKILIVDDEKANVRLLELILQQAGYIHVYSTTDSRQAVALFRSVQPDLVLLDLAMPYLDGFALMQQLQGEMHDAIVPIIVLTADATLASRHRALKEGARDFLTKPLDRIEVLLRIHNLLEIRLHNVLLEAKVRERTADLETAQWETVQRLARAAEYRDDDTGAHAQRVGRIARSIAEAMALPRVWQELIEHAATLHDIGKIGIPDSILLKPGELTREEFAIIKQHTAIGAKILSGSSSPILQMAEDIALMHHEHWDGNGYAGIQGQAIPLSARIVSVADVFDALTHSRPYKVAWAIDRAVAEIEQQSGRHFQADVIAAFMVLPHQDLV